MKLPKLLECSILNEAMTYFSYKTGDPSKLKVLDCTYAPTPPPSFRTFQDEYFGKFDKLMSKMSKHKFLYLREHIPGATFLDIDAVLYPTSTQRFSVYEPKIFEKYAQLIGLNNDDHLVFYGRGTSMPAMLFAARMYWLFKSYGHENLSVLNGGFNSWKDENGFPVESSETIEPAPTGNWIAKENTFSRYNVAIDELESGIFDKLNEINFLDARTRPQFNGDVETGLDPYNVQGSNIPGTKNTPAMEMLTDKGKLKSEAEIQQVLEKAKYLKGKGVYTMCMVGMQASLLSFALDTLTTPIESRLYDGSLYEIGHLDPKRISGGQVNK